MYSLQWVLDRFRAKLFFALSEKPGWGRNQLRTVINQVVNEIEAECLRDEPVEHIQPFPKKEKGKGKKLPT